MDPTYLPIPSKSPDPSDAKSNLAMINRSFLIQIAVCSLQSKSQYANHGALNRRRPLSTAPGSRSLRHPIQNQPVLASPSGRISRLLRSSPDKNHIPTSNQSHNHYITSTPIHFIYPSFRSHLSSESGAPARLQVSPVSWLCRAQGLGFSTPQVGWACWSLRPLAAGGRACDLPPSARELVALVTTYPGISPFTLYLDPIQLCTAVPNDLVVLNQTCLG